MKKIAFLFVSLVCALSVTATAYLGTVYVTGSEYSESNDHAIVTITQTGTNVYTLHFDDFTMPLMGRDTNFGAMDFENLKGVKGHDGFVIASATTQVGWDDLFNQYKLSTLLDRLGVLDRLKNLFDGMGDLFGGYGNIGDYFNFNGVTFPMMMTARFNDKKITADITINIAFSILGRQLMDETVNVHYQGEVPDPALYLLGSFNNWDEANKLPLTLENGKWTITQSMGKNAEFKFKDEWGKWIGSASEENVIVTRNLVEEGTEFGLAVESEKNFQIRAASDWTLNVDRENMKLVITGEWPDLRGDLNRDDIVDVADVDIAIDIILGKDSNDNWGGRADLDGNGIVDVADVNDIIDIVLGK